MSEQAEPELRSDLIACERSRPSRRRFQAGVPIAASAAFMDHCGTAPVLLRIGTGMYDAIGFLVVEE